MDRQLKRPRRLLPSVLRKNEKNYHSKSPPSLTSSLSSRERSCNPQISSSLHQGKEDPKPNCLLDEPLLTFGILTDIQHAPIPDGHSYVGKPRYYRHALKAAECAAKHFEEERVQCVINLGDFIDGRCVDAKRGGIVGFSFFEKRGSNKVRNDVGRSALCDVLDALSFYKSGNFLNCYGNHDLYNLTREEMAQTLSIPFRRESCGDLVGYYSHAIDISCVNSKHDGFLEREAHSADQVKSTPTSQLNLIIPRKSPPKKLRFIFLDTYDLSTLNRCPRTSSKYKSAQQILTTNNRNYPHNENSPMGLPASKQRYVAFNGGIDAPQLEWLEQSLTTAQSNSEKVIIFSHQPLHPDTVGSACLVWNYCKVLSLLRRYKGIVLASFSGHAHKAGYVRDEESGIHFHTLESVLESPPPICTYAMVDVWENRYVVRGFGDCTGNVHVLDHLIHVKE